MADIIFTEDSSYEFNDLIRVENNTLSCKTQLDESNITHDLVSEIKTNWTKNSLPVTPDFNRIESNLKALDLPNSFAKKLWIELQPFDFEDANRWEEQSETLLHIVTNIQHNWKRCGNYTCGG